MSRRSGPRERVRAAAGRARAAVLHAREPGGRDGDSDRPRDPSGLVRDAGRPRLVALQALVVVLVVVLLGRLWVLQVHDGERLAEAAESNRVREVVTNAARGELLDASGRPLVRNRTSLVVTVDRGELRRETDDIEEAVVWARLGEVLGRPAQELADATRPCGGGVTSPCWNGSPYQPVPVAEDVPLDLALRISEHAEEFPGVEAGLQALREYPNGTLAAHLLGYVAPISEEQLADPAYVGYRRTDLVGRGGLEEVYDADLRGETGVRRVAVDRFGVVEGVVDETPPRPGDHLVTSLDLGVQAVVEEALAAGVEKAGGDEAAAVVLDARTGRVVAMASHPSYDPGVFVGGASPEEFAGLTDSQAGVPLLNRAVQGEYPPASTWKVITTAAAVESGRASLRGRYSCPGSISIGNTVKRNFRGIGQGVMDLRNALIKSCDTLFYTFAVDDWYADNGRVEDGDAPQESLQAMARAFGFGSPTGVDLPSEASGRVTDRGFKQRRWEANKDTYCRDAETGYPDVKDRARRSFLTRLARENCSDGWRYTAGEHANLSIGQGETVVTPLQLATAYAALVNGGTLFEPRIAKAVVSADGTVREVPPVERGRVPVDPEVLDYIRAALSHVTQDGTAAGAFGGFDFDTVSVGGKTGTAEVFGKKDTAWFASFAPAEDPQFVVVAMFPDSGQGGQVAAPVVRKIYEGIYGLAGRPAALPGGRLPEGLPTVAADGAVRLVDGAAPVPPAGGVEDAG
jgi:penicillin-binding protein 2